MVILAVLPVKLKRNKWCDTVVCVRVPPAWNANTTQNLYGFSSFTMTTKKSPGRSSPAHPDRQWPEEITLDYFYQPHTITILLLSIGGLVLTAFTRLVGL